MNFLSVQRSNSRTHAHTHTSIETLALISNYFFPFGRLTPFTNAMAHRYHHTRNVINHNCYHPSDGDL